MKTKRMQYNFAIGLCSLVLVALAILATNTIASEGLSTPLQVYAAVKTNADDLIMSMSYKFDADSLVDTLPDYLSEYLRENNWKIVRTNSDSVEDEVALSLDNVRDVVGLTVPDDRRIYLSSNDVSAFYAFYHEVGHVIDYRFNWLSQSEEFQALYREEASQYADANYHQTRGHAPSSEFEFFASVCCDIFLDNEENLQSAPKTAQYIKDKTNIAGAELQNSYK